MKEHARNYIEGLKGMLDRIDVAQIEKLCNVILDAHRNDKQVFIIGNGGSASAASHMAADLGKNTAVATHKRLKVMSLTDNMAWFSALANDEGYDNVFREQLRNMMNPGDVLIGISGSGNSPNCVRAIEWANENGGITVSIVGMKGGAMKENSDVVVFLDHQDYGPLEDGHVIINHILVSYIVHRFKQDYDLSQPRKILKSVDGELIREGTA